MSKISIGKRHLSHSLLRLNIVTTHPSIATRPRKNERFTKVWNHIRQSLRNPLWQKCRNVVGCFVRNFRSTEFRAWAKCLGKNSVEWQKQCFVVMLKSLQLEAFKMELKLQKLAATFLTIFIGKRYLFSSFALTGEYCYDTPIHNNTRPEKWAIYDSVWPHSPVSSHSALSKMYKYSRLFRLKLQQHGV